MDAAEPDFLRNAEVGRPAPVEGESRRLTVAERGGRKDAARELGQRACEQGGSRNRGNPEHLVPAERELEVLDGDVPDGRLLLVEVHDSSRFPPQLRRRMRTGVALEEADRDERCDDGGEHDAEQEQRRQPEAQ
jgi:hypothetical protein